MHLIDLNDKITYQVKNYPLDDFYDKYLGELFNTLKYNVTVTNKDPTVFCIYDLLNSVNNKCENIVVNLNEIYPNKRIQFIRSKKYRQSDVNDENKQLILSVALEMSRFVNVAKSVKSFLDSEKEMMSKFTFFKDGFVYLNITDVSNLIDKVKEATEECNLLFVCEEEGKDTYIKFPLERLLLLGFSVSDITTLIHLIMSTFKYVYAIDACGSDFVKRFKLIEELTKWKTNMKQEVSDIMKRMG